MRLQKRKSNRHGIQGADSLVETETHLGAFTQAPRAKQRLGQHLQLDPEGIWLARSEIPPMK